MAENTKIQWADYTWNPWIGCTKVGPPCDNCYAEELMDTRYGRVEWGGDRVRTSESNWKLPFKWDRAARLAGLKATVFCLSLGDIWDNQVDDRWRNDALVVMERTPNLVYLLLSKRIGNCLKMTDPGAGNRPLPRNCALGATMASQEDWDRDSHKLDAARHATGAMFTFASVEPMLDHITLDPQVHYLPDWIICGGESGRNARDMPEYWARDLLGSARRAGRAFFMKQMAHREPIPKHLMLREFPPQLAAPNGCPA